MLFQLARFPTLFYEFSALYHACFGWFFILSKFYTFMCRTVLSRSLKETLLQISRVLLQGSPFTSTLPDCSTCLLNSAKPLDCFVPTPHIVALKPFPGVDLGLSHCHLICIPFLRDLCPGLHVIQSLKLFLKTYILIIF